MVELLEALRADVSRDFQAAVNYLYTEIIDLHNDMLPPLSGSTTFYRDFIRDSWNS